MDTTSRSPGRHSTVTVLALSLAAVLAVGGCSAGDKSTSSQAAPQAADAKAVQPGNDKAGQPAAGAPVQYQIDNRAIVYTGSITVRVPDVEVAADKATAIGTTADGFVGGDKRTSDDSRSEATLVLRVPAAKFGGVVDDLAGLGKQESRSIDTEDVTNEVVDLDSRIATQQASVNRTRALFSQANTITEIASVETELAKRESDLGSLEARKRTLNDLTTLSTITAILLGPEAAAPKPDREPGFLAGLGAGWGAFLGAMKVLLTVLGFVLPFAVVLGLPGWLVWRTLRRRRPATS
jgi:hypothetical protein